MKTTMTKARVLVTGSEGFLGRHLVRTLALDHRAHVYSAPSLRYDLTIAREVHRLFNYCFTDGTLDFVFHLAGYNGGIDFNRKHQADIFHANTLMALNLLEACAEYKVGKVLSVVASCAYPHMHILDESKFLTGRPHQSVAGHGFAKRNLQLASEFYREQYDLPAVCACPTTLYGPGDSFDEGRSKVMGGLIHKFVDARKKGQPSVEIWGTGSPLREFLYGPDCAKLLIETALKYNDSTQPLNLGTGQEIQIALLASLLAKLTRYTGTIWFNSQKPDGAYRKRLDLSRMHQVLGDLPPFTPLEEGVQKTITWYEENYP